MRSIYDRLPTESRLWLVLRGAGHYGFSDLGPAPLQLAHWLHIVPLDRQRQILITRDCLHTFFDVYLKGAPASRYTICRSTQRLNPRLEDDTMCRLGGLVVCEAVRRGREAGVR
jgi:hypothetical protein